MEFFQQSGIRGELIRPKFVSDHNAAASSFLCCRRASYHPLRMNLGGNIPVLGTAFFH
jgi:hypothetical protein